MNKAILLVLAFSAMLLFGCLEGPATLKPSASPTSNPVIPVINGDTQTPTAAPNANGNGLTATIAIKDFSFQPAELTVKTGTKVIWTNQDPNPHDLSSKEFTSPLLSQGQTYSHTYTKNGTYAYSCGVHPSMKGTIIVTD